MKLKFFILINFSICCMAESVIPFMTNCQLQEQLQSNISSNFFYLINVLPKSVYKDCSIPGSLNIPVHQLDKKLKRWPKKCKIILYSANDSCVLANHAYEKLSALGFSNIQILKKGMSGWFQAGYSVIGDCKAGYLR